MPTARVQPQTGYAEAQVPITGLPKPVPTMQQDSLTGQNKLYSQESDRRQSLRHPDLTDFPKTASEATVSSMREGNVSLLPLS